VSTPPNTPDAPASPTSWPAPATIVLVEPEIPNNTGSVARTCVALGCPLHLVHPLGFDIDEKACRRAGLDYWPRVDLTEHANLDAWERTLAPSVAASQADRPQDDADAPGFWLFTARAPRSIYEASIRPGDRLVFGRESVGLPPALLARHPDRLVSIPLRPGERSLNLSNAVSVAAYECVRRMLGHQGVKVDKMGRLVNN
jgi:tRNA (cytidine/uridine-2'-O-)-methyltransferase